MLTTRTLKKRVSKKMSALPNLNGNPGKDREVGIVKNFTIGEHKKNRCVVGTHTEQNLSQNKVKQRRSRSGENNLNEACFKHVKNVFVRFIRNSIFTNNLPVNSVIANFVCSASFHVGFIKNDFKNFVSYFAKIRVISRTHTERISA